MDKRKITIAITSYNRFETTLQAFANVVDDERVSEIVIVDDASEEKYYSQLKMAADANHKIKLFRNSVNADCYRNKKIAVGLALNEWVVLLDSDNVIDKSYLDRIFDIWQWDKETVFQPSFARPLFSFKLFEDIMVTKENVAGFLDKPMFSTMLNAMNYFVNKNKYLEVWQPDINPHTADSILQNYNHLKSGGSIYVVPNLEYEHVVHDGSHYKTRNHLTGNLYQEIEGKIRQLR